MNPLPPTKIDLMSLETARETMPELQALLIDAVGHGASVGFLAPLSAPYAASYWKKIVGELAAGYRLLIGAWDDTGQLIGSAQLAVESRANGRHRAEVQKVLVLACARRRGVGAALMARLEREAAARGLRLLVLDTSSGASGAVGFYHALGYTLVGSIPDNAADPDGSLVPNAIFYKRLGTPVAVTPPR